MSKRLQKHKSEEYPEHLVFLQDYYKEDFEKNTTAGHEFYINFGLYPTNTFDLLTYISGLKPGHVKDLKEIVTYRCPYTGNYYYGAFPVAYLAAEKPVLTEPKNDIEKAVHETVQFFTEGEDTYGINHIGDIGRSMLGHGYKAETLSMDVMNLGLCDIVTQPNKDEKIIFKTWKRLDSNR